MAAVNHQTPDVVPVDFGAVSVTGIHCRTVAALRDYYGLEKKPVRIVEPLQLLGEVDNELADIIGIDTVSLYGPADWFGIRTKGEVEQVTPWGQTVLIAQEIDLTPDAKGDVYCYPQGDRSCLPSGILPSQGYFFNAIERDIEVDDDDLNPDDNLEEFQPISDEDVQWFAREAAKRRATGKAVVASFGGTGLGDVAQVPGMSLKDPKGIRTVSEWYVSLIARADHVQELFERQIDTAISNYEKLWAAVGENVDIVFTCGCDFGTQESQFCSVDTFNELWLPSYKRMNNWIHENTTWKTMKHTDGAIFPLIPGLIEGGIDILNPVQFNAAGMDPQGLKDNFGDRITFWGGGVDTQKVLPYGTPAEVRAQVLDQYRILGAGGGMVLGSVHNVQADVPVENLVAMIDAIHEIRKG